MEKTFLKIGLVMANFVAGVFSLFIADAQNFLGVITDNQDTLVSAGIWNFVSIEFFVLAFVLALVFIIRSRKK